MHTKTFIFKALLVSLLIITFNAVQTFPFLPICRTEIGSINLLQFSKQLGRMGGGEGEKEGNKAKLPGSYTSRSSP